MRLQRANYGHQHDIIRGLDLLTFGSESTYEGPEVGNVYWILWHEGEAAGYCSIRPLRESSYDPHHASTAFLSRAVVLPHARGQGLQRRMIRARVKWAVEEGYERVVTTLDWDNIPSLRNLVKEGFVPYVPFYDWTESDGGGCLFLEKVL